MMQGRVHFDDERITIIFINGGAYSFQLHEVNNESVGKWYGSIGLNKGYQLEIDRWLDAGSFRGTWQMEGEMVKRALRGRYIY